MFFRPTIALSFEQISAQADYYEEGAKCLLRASKISAMHAPEEKAYLLSRDLLVARMSQGLKRNTALRLGVLQAKQRRVTYSDSKWMYC